MTHPSVMSWLPAAFDSRVARRWLYSPAASPVVWRRKPILAAPVGVRAVAGIAGIASLEPSGSCCKRCGQGPSCDDCASEHERRSAPGRSPTTSLECTA